MKSPATKSSIQISPLASTGAGLSLVVVLGLAVVGFEKLEQSKQLVRPGHSVAGVPPLTPPQSGETVVLPEYDVRGNKVPEGPLLLLTLPDCNSCSIKGIDISAIPKAPRTPIVILLSGPGTIKQDILAREPKLTIVFKDSCKLPNALQFYANTVVTLDANRRVTGFADPRTSSAFLSRWSRQ